MSERTRVQRKKDADLDAVPQLAQDTHAFMEPQFGFDLGQVQIQHSAPTLTLQPKLTVSQPGDPYEQEADRVADQVMRMSESTLQRVAVEDEQEEKQQQLALTLEKDEHKIHRAADPLEEEIEDEQQHLIPPVEDDKEPDVQRYADQTQGFEVAPQIEASVVGLRGGGQPLDDATRAFMEPRFGRDFGHVRVHTSGQSADSARSVSASAYTIGSDVVFGAGQYSPGSDAGRRLLAHELTHVVQQSSQRVGRGSVIQRRVEMRDVGKGEQSGFARLPELIERLNNISQALTFSMNGNELAYSRRAEGANNNFDSQMINFIDQEVVIPLRLTDRHGLLGNRNQGYHIPVLADAWPSGYVDIDDLLASSDLGLQLVLVHFLRERSATSNYANRIGSPSLNPMQATSRREFNHAHALGIEAEVQLLQDFFNDPTIRFVSEPNSGDAFRIYLNSRRDRIRARLHSEQGENRGAHAVFIDVVTRDGKKHTAEEYRAILEAEHATGQGEQQRQNSTANQEEEFALQRFTDTSKSALPALQTELFRAALHGSGRPLDPQVRAFMEPRFGHDFGHVRVHTDAIAARSAESVSALAYTVGNDVVFGAGHYQPGTDAGRRLIAHELTHVVQSQEPNAIQRKEDNAHEIADSATAIKKLKEIQGLPMYALLPQLRALSADLLADEHAGVSVGGPRLVIAMRAARAGGGSWFDFGMANADRLVMLPSDQIADILIFLGIPVNKATLQTRIETIESTSLNDDTPDNEFWIVPPGVRPGSMPIFDDQDTHAVIGFRYSSGGFYQIYDLDGIFVESGEIPLERPLIDPIDIVAGLFAGLFTSGVRSAARGVGRAAGRIGGEASVSGGVRGILGTLSRRALDAVRATYRSIILRDPLSFTETAAAHMAEPGRRVPLHILKLALRYGQRSVDPQRAAGTFRYVIPMLRKDKQYILEVVIREADRTIVHFLYER